MDYCAALGNTFVKKYARNVPDAYFLGDQGESLFAPR